MSGHPKELSHGEEDRGLISSLTCKTGPPCSATGTMGILPAAPSLFHQLTDRTSVQSRSSGWPQKVATGKKKINGGSQFQAGSVTPRCLPWAVILSPEREIDSLSPGQINPKGPLEGPFLAARVIVIRSQGSNLLLETWLVPHTPSPPIRRDPNQMAESQPRPKFARCSGVEVPKPPCLTFM